MIASQRKIGGMHGASRIVSGIPCLTIVPERMVFRGSRKKPIISKAGYFGGTADGISLSKIFLSILFQWVIMLINNRVGVRADTPSKAGKLSKQSEIEHKCGDVIK